MIRRKSSDVAEKPCVARYCLNTEDKGIQLQDITTEKDLGIWITRDLKPREQCIQSAKKVQSVLVRRHFKEIDKDDFKSSVLVPDRRSGYTCRKNTSARSVICQENY